MAKDARRKPKGGRVTPKATGTKASGTASGRYTPPIPREQKVSPRWIPALMFTCLALGMVIIVCNYLGVLPGDAKNSYLLVGLGLITAGFITATQYH